MAATSEKLYQNVSKTDPLNFWSNHGLDYRSVTEFLELNTSELSKIGGVAKSSVRFDAKIPKDLKERLEQIANIVGLVAEYFEGDPARTALWFKTPNPLLGEISPRDMIRYGRYRKLLNFVIQANGKNTSQ